MSYCCAMVLKVACTIQIACPTEATSGIKLTGWREIDASLCN